MYGEEDLTSVIEEDTRLASSTTRWMDPVFVSQWIIDNEVWTPPSRLSISCSGSVVVPH